MTSVKRDLTLFVAAFTIFALCCLGMIFGHSAISSHPAKVYAFLATWGGSAIVFPIFLVKLATKLLTLILKR